MFNNYRDLDSVADNNLFERECVSELKFTAYNVTGEISFLTSVFSLFSFPVSFMLDFLLSTLLVVFACRLFFCNKKMSFLL